MKAPALADELRTMAFDRRKVEQRVSGFEGPLNEHLIKLMGLDAPERTRTVWKREIKGWLRRVSILRLKPDSSPLPPDDIYRWLFDEPFGGVEAENAGALLDALAREMPRVPRHPRPPEEVARRLEALHRELAPRLSRGDPAADLIDAL